MRKVELVAIVLALLGASPLLAQEAGDAYDDYFGWENEGMGGEQEPEAAGPSSMKEARLTGRGYRVGGGSSMNPKGDREVHVVQEGDTLWDISQHYYGDPWNWPELWSFNPEITNPHWIYPADQVRLSPSSVPTDQLVAKATGGGEASATPGMVSGTEAAPSVIVPLACESAKVALTALDRLTRKSSFGSSSTSPRTGTVMDFVVWPGAKVSEPEVAE